MEKKVILISIDGMRADGVQHCGNPFLEELKKIGSYAREEMERVFGTKVYLNLWVKVKENWRDSANLVGNFGYKSE